MKAKLNPLINLAILASVALALQSCAQDIVGKAEQTTHATATSFDAFLQFELDNRAQLLAINPGIHEFAQKLRHKECPSCDQNGIRWLKTARAYTEAYRLNRTEDNKFRMETALALVNTTFAQIAQYYLEAQTAGIRRP